MDDENPPHGPHRPRPHSEWLTWDDVLKEFRTLGRRAVADPGGMTEEEIQEIAWGLLVLSDIKEEVTAH